MRTVANENFVHELKGALERSFGFAIRSLVQLDGRMTLNFKAVRASDGLPFVVKCVPPAKRASYDHTQFQLKALAGTKAVARLFPDGLCRFDGYDVMYLSWCEGERLFPDELTDTQADLLLTDYLSFSAVLQRSRPNIPPDDIVGMRQRTLPYCRGLWAKRIRRLLETELKADRLALRPELTRIIHGDFHHGNFLFKDGRVSGFFDFENVTLGYPTEDLIRYVVCASEHLRWYEQYRKRRILEIFRRMVERAPYSATEWETAINRLLMSKIARKAENYGLGFWMMCNLIFRMRYYRVMKRIVSDVFKKERIKKTEDDDVC